MRDVAGKVAVVTGAASGIGHALAARLAGDGARLVLADVDGAALAEAAGGCGPAAPRCWRCPPTSPTQRPSTGWRRPPPSGSARCTCW